MGCDIHMCLEKKNNDGKWESIDLYEKTVDGYSLSSVYHDRWYALFTALCGVRDYDSGNQKISEPKGVPEDVSIETQAEIASWEGDGHSHSWNTLQELYEFSDKNKEVERKIFKTLIEAIENQAERFRVYDPKEEADKIRIVYFFDN